MHVPIKFVSIALTMFMLYGCGGGDSSTSMNGKTAGSNEYPVDIEEVVKVVDWRKYSTTSVALSGRITYDLVPPNTNHIGLDYRAIKKEPSKWVDVRIIAKNGDVFGHTFTDENGNYHFNELPSAKDVKIQVRAKMLHAGTPSWKVEVLDNTNLGKNNKAALYVMQGDVFSTGENNSTHDLHAESGWVNGRGYTSIRAAAPFAILDTIQSAMKKVLSAEKNASFPPLQVFWSKKNTRANGEVKYGQIGTSYYQNRKLYILGDDVLDTDEYDTHIIAHEWGHYYEDTFSRSDSIGGSHDPKEKLDIRLAFSEGWGNAFSAMALDDPIYFDTGTPLAGNGFLMNMEDRQTGRHEKVDGWFSEASIQHILYDIYDSHSDGPDTVSLGFAPIHEVMTHAQKHTQAFTSLFPFILGIQKLNPEVSMQINNLLDDESINPIMDIWGKGNSENPYKIFSMGKQSNFVFDYTNGTIDRNKLGNHLYYKFTIDTSAYYMISVKGANGTDPDFTLYGSKGSSALKFLDRVYKDNGNIESKNKLLEAGQYILDINDFNQKTGAQFTLNITPQ